MQISAVSDPDPKHWRKERQVDRQTCRQTDRQVDRCRQTCRQADRQVGRQIGRQTDRQADRQEGRQIGRQTGTKAAKKQRSDFFFLNIRQNDKMTNPSANILHFTLIISFNFSLQGITSLITNAFTVLYLYGIPTQYRYRYN